MFIDVFLVLNWPIDLRTTHCSPHYVVEGVVINVTFELSEVTFCLITHRHCCHYHRDKKSVQITH